MSYCCIIRVNGGTRKNTSPPPPRGLVLCQVIGSANVCSSSLEGISWLVAVSTMGHCGKPTYKRGHSVAVNTAWFSSRLHVEARRQPDLQWLRVAMAMSLLLLSCLHVALTCLLLHGEFYGFCCKLYWFLGRLIFPWKQRWLDKEPRDMTLKCRVLAVFLWEEFLFFCHYDWYLNLTFYTVGDCLQTEPNLCDSSCAGENPVCFLYQVWW